MNDRRRSYYYGSYGLVRGYGPLCTTLREADDSVFADSRKQRTNGGSTDRNVVLVSPETGLCWWWEEGDYEEEDLVPVRMPNGEQASYSLNKLGPTEMAGFG